VKLSALIFFLVFSLVGVTHAQTPIQAASSDELVEKLTPSSSGMRTRGMRNLTPEEKAKEAAPSVDLSIQFEFDSAKLLPESKPLLNNLAKAINSDNLKSYTFLVEGHTDAVGSAEYNQRLSNQRALAVASYLSALGVSRSRLKTYGKGSGNLLFPEKPDSAENRRVKIVLSS